MRDPRDIIKMPVISEKSMRNVDNGKYVFKVARDANKIEINRAVNEIFNVEVKSINTINFHPKKRGLGRFEGTKPSWKKAIITLKEGEKIPDFFEGM